MPKQCKMWSNRKQKIISSEFRLRNLAGQSEAEWHCRSLLTNRAITAYNRMR